MSIFSWFSRNPKFLNVEFNDLALMLFQERSNPTYKVNNLDAERLDFSLESLNHIDDYLDSIYEQPPGDDDYLKVVLRVGAYVGEVMRKQSPNKYNWLSHEEASKISETISNWESSIATAGILWAGDNSFSFPLAKVCKYLENGREDSLFFLQKCCWNNKLSQVGWAPPITVKNKVFYNCYGYSMCWAKPTLRG